MGRHLGGPERSPGLSARCCTWERIELVRAPFVEGRELATALLPASSFVAIERPLAAIARPAQRPIPIATTGPPLIVLKQSFLI